CALLALSAAHGQALKRSRRWPRSKQLGKQDRRGSTLWIWSGIRKPRSSKAESGTFLGTTGHRRRGKSLHQKTARRGGNEPFLSPGTWCATSISGRPGI